MDQWLFWVICGSVFGAVAFILARVLWHHFTNDKTTQSPFQHNPQYDLDLYKNQLSTLEYDVSRGAISQNEAEQLKAEISRRLLEADRALQNQPQNALSHQAADEKTIAVQNNVKKSLFTSGFGVPCAALLVIMGGAFFLYNKVGAPGYNDLPLTKRLDAARYVYENRPSQAEAEARVELPITEQENIDPEFLNMIEQLRAIMKKHPDDPQGLELLARNEASLGNLNAAQNAQMQLITIKGDSATAIDYTFLAELMVLAAGGYVSPEAETNLAKALQLDTNEGRARYYVGLMFAQVGRFDRAFSLWKNLLEVSPSNAPWLSPLRDQLPEVAALAGVRYTLPPLADALAGPSAENINAAKSLSDTDRQAMIENMVTQLGARLANDGGSPQEWAQLIMSLGVLNRQDEAQEIYNEATTHFANQEDTLAFLRQTAQNAGISP